MRREHLPDLDGQDHHDAYRRLQHADLRSYARQFQERCSQARLKSRKILRRASRPSRWASAASRALPPTIPVGIAPSTATPGRKDGTVYGTAFRVIKGSLGTVRAARPNSQGLWYSRRRIHTKSTVPHAEGRVPRSQLTKLLRDIHVPARHPVSCIHNHISGLGSTVPSGLPPTVPPGKHCSVDKASFAILDRFRLASVVAYPDSQGLGSTRSGIHAKGIVVHLKTAASARQFADTHGDIGAGATRTIFRVNDLKLLRSGETRQRQHEHVFEEPNCTTWIHRDPSRGKFFQVSRGRFPCMRSYPSHSFRSRASGKSASGLDVLSKTTRI